MTINKRFLSRRISDHRLIWHELSYIAWLVMEVAWPIPWLVSLIRPEQQPSTWTALGMLLLISFSTFYLSRAMEAGRIPALLSQLLLFLLFLVWLALTIKFVVYGQIRMPWAGVWRQTLFSLSRLGSIFPPELAVLFACLYAWRRGILGASIDVLRSKRTALRFRFGLLALLVYGISHVGHASIYLLEIVPVYFSAGLLGMALSTAENLSLVRGVRRSPFTGSWFRGVLLILGGLVTAGWLMGWLMRSSAAYGFARDLGRGFVGLVYLVISPLLFGGAWLSGQIVKFVSSLLPELEEQIVATEGASDFEGVGQLLPPWAGQAASNFIGWLEQHAALIALVALLIGVLVYAWLTARRRRRAQLSYEELEEAGDRLRGGLGSGLRRRLEGLLDQISQGARLNELRRLLAASTVRRIYARLLSRSRRLGAARRASETPLEYLQRLEPLYPGQLSDVQMITEAYLLVRYGEFPDEALDLEAVQASWERLRSAKRSSPEPAEDAGPTAGGD